ncbi:SulP family inorganic anion transporter [Herbaspirillum sp. RTI4]|uniref:SLC26A/SulP transporter family protein n=1 Tax=Herbaspirillum sp. RTI4 TaxID=3048640 RepID=UPI002AB393D9|nr:SulP family inorganic anion transporter [Herbaspirillum sp. RTI4]MDY7578473.1 SulP family inorganic anion transporter [Herbaspirillum sp. RTI4]MEA9981498.1 SulP family inorganic anion transporter [Herbaspirillum sp. RTI4]
MTSTIQSFLRAVPGQLPAALVLALISISFTTSYAAMIYGSGGSALLAVGLPLLLLSLFVIMLLSACTSSLPFMVGGTDTNSVAVLSLLVAGIVGEMHANGSTPPQIAVTVMVAVSLSTLISGLCMLMLGGARRGNLVQFIPFPVVGGFLAGSGYLLLSGAFGIATGQELSFFSLPLLLHTHWLVLVPMLMVTGLMVLASKRQWRHPIVLPLILLGASAVFFIGLHLSDSSVEQARSMGWMFQPLPHSSELLPFNLPLSEVNWSLLSHHYREVLAMVVVVTLALLLNATAISLATKSEIDFNHELRSTGIANLVSGLMGGGIGAPSLSRTMINYRAGSRSRVTGVLAALFVLLFAGFFSDMISLVPKPVLAGLLGALAWGLLEEWVIKSRRHLSRSDYLLILLILVVIAVSGFVAGVVLGVMVACVLFVVDYGSISCIQMAFSGSSLTSRLERDRETSLLLKEEGYRIFGVCLQGFLFFGSSNQMVERVREQLRLQVEYVVIDFRRVQGVDASTSQSFIKLRQICNERGVTLVLTGVTESARLSLAHALGQGVAVPEFEYLDSGLEWIENALLQKLQTEQVAPDWHQSMAQHFAAEQLPHLFARLEVIDLQAGDLLFNKGDNGDGMYFIEYGQVSIWLSWEGGRPVRLRSFGSGTIVGEMALYTGLQRTADVMTDRPTRAHRLSAIHLRELEKEEPATALQLHNYVVKTIAGRLAVTNEAYRLSF